MDADQAAAGMEVPPDDTKVADALREASRRHASGEYDLMLMAARHAAQLAAELDDIELQVRAWAAEGRALQRLGEAGAALDCYAAVLEAAEDPDVRDRLFRGDLARLVAQAHMDWVACARVAGSVPPTEMLAILDQGEAFLDAVERPGWRGGLCAMRARLLRDMGMHTAALPFAREALDLVARHPDAPGYTLASCQWELADALRELRQYDDAAPMYRAVLDEVTSHPTDRLNATIGLGWCSHATGDLVTLLATAETAEAIAADLGPSAQCAALELVVSSARVAGDRDRAREAAERHIQIAFRMRGRYQLYFAFRDAVDVALDEGDTAHARLLLEQAAPCAATLDAQRGGHAFRDDIARRERRLQQLEATIA